jgi:hypothetical protein
MAGRYKAGWSKQHQKVFELYTGGSTPAEIVKDTGYPIDRVRNIIRCDRFQEQHDEIVKNSVETARKTFEARLTEAAGQIIRIMKHGKPDERIRFDAAKEVLYQCGLKPVEVVENRTRQYTPEEIKSSLAAVKEIQTIEGTLAVHGSRFIIKRDKDHSEPSESTVLPPVEEAKVAE